jgi:hypothetical protein
VIFPERLSFMDFRNSVSSRNWNKSEDDGLEDAEDACEVLE